MAPGADNRALTVGSEGQTSTHELASYLFEAAVASVFLLV